MEYIELSSYKYMAPVVQQEQESIRQARNTKAIRDLTTFLFGLVAIRVGVLAVQNMDVWRPHVENFASVTGIF